MTPTATPMTTVAKPSTGQDLLALVVSLVLVLVVGTIAAGANAGNVAGWYHALAKPAWTPPDSWFPVVWTVLYVLMGVAAWLVWRDFEVPGRAGALALYLVQLALNALWSFVFFDWHLIGWGLFEIAVLWLFVLATTFAFWQINRLAGVLLLPYLVWTTYAAALNLAIWLQNPPGA
ncbi:MAG: tryptophan-rich sensory protein [Geminicoccaceae bacterium]|nr:tryptophan-rich sensory protein [Geminicoccaceae bacterium]